MTIHVRQENFGMCNGYPTIFCHINIEIDADETRFHIHFRHLSLTPIRVIKKSKKLQSTISYTFQKYVTPFVSPR